MAPEEAMDDQHETIMLIGRDGRPVATLQWKGGDVVSWPAPRPMTVLMSKMVAAGNAGIKTDLYRRSLTTKHWFVFQP